MYRKPIETWYEQKFNSPLSENLKGKRGKGQRAKKESISFGDATRWTPRTQPETLCRRRRWWGNSRRGQQSDSTPEHPTRSRHAVLWGLLYDFHQSRGCCHLALRCNCRANHPRTTPKRCRAYRRVQSHWRESFPPPSFAFGTFLSDPVRKTPTNLNPCHLFPGNLPTRLLSSHRSGRGG